MSLSVSLSPLFPQGAPEWKDLNFHFKKVQSAAVLRQKRGTRHFALWKRGVADKTKKVTCIIKNPAQTMHTCISLRKRHHFFSFDLSLSLSFWPTKRIFSNNTAWDLVKGNANREAGEWEGEHHNFGACDRCQSSAIFSSCFVFQRTIYLFQHQACHPSRLDVVPPSSGSIWGRGGEEVGCDGLMTSCPAVGSSTKTHASK